MEMKMKKKKKTEQKKTPSCVTWTTYFHFVDKISTHKHCFPFSLSSTRFFSKMTASYSIDWRCDLSFTHKKSTSIIHIYTHVDIHDVYNKCTSIIDPSFSWRRVSDLVVVIAIARTLKDNFRISGIVLKILFNSQIYK